MFDADHRKFDSGVRSVQNQVASVTKDLGKATTSTKQLTDATDTAGTGLSSMGVSLGVAAGAAVVSAAAIGSLTVGLIAAGNAIWTLTNQAITMGGKLHDLAQQTNFSVETLSALGNAAETSGGSLESITASLGIFQKHLESANSEGVNADVILKAWNIDLKDNERALEQVLLRLSAMEAGTTQTAYALQLFGRSGKQMLAIMKDSGGDLDKFKASMAEAGLEISGTFAQSMDEAGDNMTRLGQHTRKLQAEIGEQFVPQVNRAVLELTKFLKENRTEIAAWGAAIANVTKDIFAWRDAITGSNYAVSFWRGAMTDVAQSTQVANVALALAYRSVIAFRNAMAGPFGGVTGGVGSGSPEIGGDFRAPVFPLKFEKPGGGGGGRGRAAKRDTTAEDKLKAEMKALAEAAKLAEREIEKLAREEERLAGIAEDVNEAIFQQHQAISDLETGYPRWLRDANDFIVAKFKEGHAWDAETMAIYRNSAARLEQLRVLGEGATRPLRVFELATGNETRPRFATSDRENERLQNIREQMERLADDVTGIWDRALYDGIHGGGMRGLQSLALGFLDMIQQVVLGQLKNALAQALTGGAGGGGGWVAKAIGWITGAAVGGVAGGGTWSDFGKNLSIPGRASGGAVSAGMPYMVGEQGRELFVSNKPGQIIPNNKISGTTINHFNFTVRQKGTQSFKQNRSKREFAERVAALVST